MLNSEPQLKIGSVLFNPINRCYFIVLTIVPQVNSSRRISITYLDQNRKIHSIGPAQKTLLESLIIG
jgi:hypothetical protein